MFFKMLKDIKGGNWLDYNIIRIKVCSVMYNRLISLIILFSLLTFLKKRFSTKPGKFWRKKSPHNYWNLSLTISKYTFIAKRLCHTSFKLKRNQIEKKKSGKKKLFWWIDTCWKLEKGKKIVRCRWNLAKIRRNMISTNYRPHMQFCGLLESVCPAHFYSDVYLKLFYLVWKEKCRIAGMEFGVKPNNFGFTNMRIAILAQFWRF